MLKSTNSELTVIQCPRTQIQTQVSWILYAQSSLSGIEVSVMTWVYQAISGLATIMLLICKTERQSETERMRDEERNLCHKIVANLCVSCEPFDDCIGKSSRTQRAVVRTQQTEVSEDRAFDITRLVTHKTIRLQHKFKRNRETGTG